MFSSGDIANAAVLAITAYLQNMPEGLVATTPGPLDYAAAVDPRFVADTMICVVTLLWRHAGKGTKACPQRVSWPNL